MIAKEYTYYINEWFQHTYKNKNITFVNKESSEPAKVNFGDRRIYKIEIWMVNFVTDTKEKVFGIQDIVQYEDGKMKPIFVKELLKRLYVLTFNNLNELQKYGVQ